MPNPERPTEPQHFEFLADYNTAKSQSSAVLGDAVEAALATLSPREAEVVSALVYQKLSFAEAAEALDITKSTVQSYWARAKLKLMVGLTGPLDLDG